MSGICGVVRWDGVSVGAGVVQHMIEAASHRAVDGSRFWLSTQAQLGHLALHVTPEDALEPQPVVDGELVLVADARIDNRDELLAVLDARRLPDQPTDADLILAAYRRWGDESPAHLIGDFAFAIWDSDSRRLFCARDPMAMRMVYMHSTPRLLVFATELKQVLAVPGVPVELDEATAAKYLIGDFDTPDTTHYAGVGAVPAGHALAVDASGQRMWRFWDIDPERRVRHRDERDYIEHFLDIFKGSVQARARAIRPLGVLLSGGMDSGSVASTLGWLRNGGHSTPPVHAYSWAFDKLPQCDERSVSDANARHYGFIVEHVSADHNAPLARYPDHGPDRDEPKIGVYQALLEGTLVRARGDGVGAMLSGDRGDLMAGALVLDYTRLLRDGRWAALRHELREHVDLSRSSFMSVALSHLIRPLVHKGWRASVRGSRRALLRIAGSRGTVPLAPIAPWIAPDLLACRGLGNPSPPTARNRPGFVHASSLRRDLVFLPIHMRGMTWSERTCARFGQAFVDPWSDRRLAEFVVAIPQQVLNLPGRNDKQFVREAMRGIMPEDVRRSTAKVVPTPLYRRALRETAVDTIRDLITNTQLGARGWIDEPTLRTHYEQVLGGRAAHPSIWWAITLEMWLRRYWT